MKCLNSRLRMKNLANEKDALNSIHRNALDELETYKNALFERTADADIEEKRLIHSLQAETTAKMEKLQSEVETHKKHAFELQLNEEKMTQTITALTHKNSDLSNQVEVLKANLKRAKEEAEDIERRYSNKPSITEDDLIPLTVWHFTGFDTALTQKIDQIGRNTVLHPSSKITSAFKAIQKYYAKKMEQRCNDLNSVNSDYVQLKQAMSAFLVDLSGRRR